MLKIETETVSVNFIPYRLISKDTNYRVQF